MNSKQRFKNITSAELVEQAVKRNEGILSATGAFLATTGYQTGRSPKDKFIVKDDLTENTVEWNAINQPFAPADFDKLWTLVAEYMETQDNFISELHIGAHEQHYLPIKLITQRAWHNLFGKTLFIEPEVFNPNKVVTWQILHAPDFKCQPERDKTRAEGCVIVNFEQCKVLIAGMRYAGEIKKSMFSVQNFLLPDADVLPMHCAANAGEKGDVALFFGLSGTGKTTLSADPKRYLIGDDEHGWTRNRVFNFEGGCYAKCINLSRENEPIIWDAIRFGSVLENVILDEKRIADYRDTSLTKNTRVAYPLEHVEKRVLENSGNEPKNILFLTCDLNGVIPPVSILSKEAAAYHFLNGYTALVGSTELGSKPGIQETFSTCFGEPFFARPAYVYANLLMKRIEAFDTKVFLVNTGWTGGNYGIGRRFKISETRAIVTNILEDNLKSCPTTIIPLLNLEIPTALEGIDSKILDPRKAWADQAAYLETVKKLVRSFNTNFKKYEVDPAIVKAGPSLE